MNLQQTVTKLSTSPNECHYTMQREATAAAETAARPSHLLPGAGGWVPANIP